MPKIESITCHKILNSRGDWTIEAHVNLTDGSVGVQTIPEGTSKGENEAVSVPVDKAVEIVSTVLNDALKGDDPTDQLSIDKTLIEMDGTANKRHLGGNSILSVSLAVAHAAAVSKGWGLWEYLSLLYSGKRMVKSKITYPTPVFNIINGGKHAHDNLSFQEFMVIPAKDMPITKALELGSEVYMTLKENLLSAGYDIDVGDEGGFAPNGFTVEKALTFIRDAASQKYIPGKDVFFGMDVAAESFYQGDGYEIREEKIKLGSDKMADYHLNLIKKFEIIYLEDPFYEKDISAWHNFYKRVGRKLMLVADDLVVTNKHYLKKAVEEKLASAVIVKPNQVGTLTETFDFIKMAKAAKMAVVVSHRSGDTAEDTFIADLGVAVEADFMKAGAPVRGERVAKYNRLLEILAQ